MKAEIPYREAKDIADKLVLLLSPHCYRIEIAGSIRREKDIVGDVEIVCIPKPYQTGLFEDGIAEIVNQWQKVKGELEYGKTKYTQRILPEGIKLDLFFAEEGNWGLIFAIRTGSEDYSHKVLANGWVKRGYKSEGGYLMQNGKTYEVREEKDLFDRIGVAYVEPKHRTI
jgi:DNA polymerase/3'-5' exonuclease PolX